MPLILALESSTRRCSVALFRDGRELAWRDQTDPVGFVHAEKLHLFIQEVLQEADLTPADLDAVAVGLGPGSYTGLRIGASAAKGLAHALNIPVMGVGSLQVLAWQAHAWKPEANRILAVIDARRMEVYAQWFSGSAEPTQQAQNEVLTTGSFLAQDHHVPTVVVGDCTTKCQTVLPADWHFLPDEGPTARAMGTWVEEAFSNSEFLDLAYFEPYYFKAYQAGSPRKPSWVK